MNGMRPRCSPSSALTSMPRRAVFGMLCLFVVASPAAAQSLYRWVDDQGNVHYTDSIPPTQAGKAHVEMSEQGMRMREVPRVKTPEEVERERELERLRAQQEELIEERKAADQRLLRKYRSVDDLIMASDGKLAAIDFQIQMDKGSIPLQQTRLASLRAEAAESERQDRPVDEKLAADIADAERAIQETLSAILRGEEQKRELRVELERDLERFRELRNLSPTQHDEAMLDAGKPLDNIIRCQPLDECERLWQRAIAYVERHATVPIEVAGENVVMTVAPAKQADIALILSRLWEPDAQRGTIFLDMRCRSSQASTTACQTEAQHKVLDGFRVAVEGRQPAASPGSSSDR